MKKMVSKLFFKFILFFLTGSLFLAAQPLSLEEVVEKNLALAGAEKISQIENYLFRSGSENYFLSSDGIMKITEGKEPVVSEIILVEKDKVTRNCFGNIQELSGIMKVSYQAMAKLRSGLFTLKNFRDILEYRGLKKFGAKEHHVLLAEIEELETRFYLDPDDFSIKRIVLHGYYPDESLYEVNLDFGPYQNFQDFYLPQSWFVSQVGTRGQLYEISEIQFNKELPPDFFSSLELNMGEVEIGKERLKGNVVDFNIARKDRLMLSTNWTVDCLTKAGFSPGDKVILKAAEIEIPVSYFEERPPREEMGPGAIFMIPDPQDQNLIIYILSSEYSALSENLDLLLPVELTK
ncbi:MAG: hypothetical protein ACOC57_00735 [Acidobacteriota bacterium]